MVGIDKQPNPFTSAVPVNGIVSVTNEPNVNVVSFPVTSRDEMTGHLVTMDFETTKLLQGDTYTCSYNSENTNEYDYISISVSARYRFIFTFMVSVNNNIRVRLYERSDISGGHNLGVLSYNRFESINISDALIVQENPMIQDIGNVLRDVYLPKSQMNISDSTTFQFKRLLDGENYVIELYNSSMAETNKSVTMDFINITPNNI